MRQPQSSRANREARGRNFTPPSPPWVQWAAGMGWRWSRGSNLVAGPLGSVAGEPDRRQRQLLCVLSVQVAGAWQVRRLVCSAHMPWPQMQVHAPSARVDEPVLRPLVQLLELSRVATAFEFLPFRLFLSPSLERSPGKRKGPGARAAPPLASCWLLGISFLIPRQLQLRRRRPSLLVDSRPPDSGTRCPGSADRVDPLPLCRCRCRKPQVAEVGRGSRLVKYQRTFRHWVDDLQSPRSYCPPLNTIFLRRPERVKQYTKIAALPLLGLGSDN
jgi:hypothetical protein